MTGAMIANISLVNRSPGQTIAIWTAILAMICFLALPVWALLSQSFTDTTGNYIGLANFIEYFATPALFQSIRNSLLVASACTVIVVSCAFIYAYALQKSCIPGKAVFKLLAQLPLLAPSMMPAIGLIYLFGNQGILKAWFLTDSIYGGTGIVIGLSIWCFPHALMIISNALSMQDQRIHDAAQVMNTPGWRKLLLISLPAARYGLISASLVVFTLVLADFGVPKVIGGQFDVLATDIYKQVVGQQNFQTGAVVGILLLIPSVIAFILDRLFQSKQRRILASNLTPYQAKPKLFRDGFLLIFCLIIASALITVIGMAVYASFVTFWPYNLEFTLANYNFDLMDGGGWNAWFNSLELALLSAVFGTVIVFSGAWLSEKSSVGKTTRSFFHLLAYTPLAVPGLVLGLGYIFFFNQPENPLNFLYGSMAILVLSTIVHYYTVPHLTVITQLKQIPDDYNSIANSLKVAPVQLLRRVTLPLSVPALLDISVYLFLAAMTTVSAVIFLYTPDTTLSSVAILNMDEAGDIAPAAAMATVILCTSIIARLLHSLLTYHIKKHSQRWQSKK